MLFALVPSLTIMFFALESISNQNTLREHHLITNDFISSAISLVNVVSKLQIERGIDLAISSTKLSSQLVVSMTNQQRKSDQAISDYFDFLQSIKSSPKEWLREKEFKHLHDGLNGLNDLRLRDNNIDGFKLYSELINAALSILQSLQTSSDNAVLASKTSLYSTLLLLQEYYAQERGIINGILSQGKVNVIQSYAINSIINKQNELLDYFTSIAPNTMKQRVDELLSSRIHKDVDYLKQTIVHRAEHSDLLNRLQVFFGYGGMIHSYKNYLLRGEKRDLYAFNFASNEADNIIREMRRLKSISITELKHLDILQDTIDTYRDKFLLMQKLKNNHLSIKQIDAQTGVNDFLALTSLSALLDSEINIDRTIWWEKTSLQLLSFEKLSNEIKESIRLLSTQNVENATKQFYNSILLMSATFLIIILLASMILRRLVVDISAISKSMNRMVTTGEYDNTLIEVSGHDEIATMAKSFNLLLSNIDTSQKQLMGQKLAMDEHSIVSTTDLKGSITYVNQKFCDVSGYTKEELMGANHSLLNSGNQSKEYWHNMFSTISNGGVWHDEVKNFAKDGHAYWVDTTIVPISWETHEANSKIKNHKGYISIRTDISKSKQQELTLLNAKISAEAATIAKSQFLATMSHEIRTPMNGVIGMAQLLEDTPLNDEQKDYLDTIRRSGSNLLSIINDILDFSKLDADMVDIESIPFDLENLCQESVMLVGSNSTDKNLEFILDYAPDCARHFMGDPSRIRQILLNFLGNSAKFTKQGFVRLGVSSIKIMSNRTLLKIDVQDTGIGLKPTAIKTLFDEFTQADSTTTREYGGTGLGLAITKKIAHLMSGKIKVDSVFGEGSTFSLTISLPIASESTPKKATSLQNVRILLVDDHHENLRIFKRLLNHMGVDITLEINPLNIEALALKAIKEGKPYQIIILDHDMAQMNGKELGIQIRKNSKLDNTKLLIFSSIGQKGDANLFLKCGFNAYLNKLSRYDTLKEVLVAMLSHKQGQPLITQYSIKDTQKEPGDVQTDFKAKVLVVEDVLPNQIIAKKILTKMGLEVDLANNGQEALDAIKKQTYDLVFMDCRMPVMDGYEATQIIRRQEEESKNKRLPIIALTANASNDDKVFCQQAGMDDIVTKPFMFSDLSKSLQKWLKVPVDGFEKANKELKFAKTKINIIDKTILQQLKDDMGEDFDNIKNAIFDSIQGNLSLLIERNDKTLKKDLIRFAHSIKSPAANLGMMRLSQLAQTLESDLKKDQFDHLEQTVVDMNKALKSAKQEFLEVDK